MTNFTSGDPKIGGKDRRKMKTKFFVEFEKRKDSYITLLQCGACCRIVGSLQRKLNADCRSRDSETANSPLLFVRLDSYVIMMCYFFTLSHL